MNEIHFTKGKYIPHLAMKIHEENKVENATQVNLKGLITGGPFTDPLIMTSQFSDYYFNLGLIDESGRAYFKQQETLTAKLIEEGKHEEAIKVFIIITKPYNIVFIVMLFQMF